MILLKKALRSMWDNKKAYIACMVLLSIGILMFVGMGSATNSLSVALNNYYKEGRLADIFAKVKAIPKNDLEKLRKLEGIADVLGRQTIDVRVVMPDSEKVIMLRLISTDTKLQNPLNGIVWEGSDFYNDNDIMIGKDFIEAHGLTTGDIVTLVINGREQIFNICASAQSPEYIYVVKEGEMLPDPETFDVAFVKEETLFTLLNRPGLYNDICFQLQQGYTYDMVKSELEDELSSYGITQLISKKDQFSFSMMDTEITSNQQVSSVLPYVFIFMSIFILYLMLKRVIEQERAQIGTLKAFGYSNGSILLNYLTYGLITSIIGGIIGCALGYALTGYEIDMYSEYFSLPNLVRSNSMSFFTMGMVISIVSGIMGAYAGAKNILKLNPADAMRPEAPKKGKAKEAKPSLLSRIFLNSRGVMALRNISRNKWRSLFIVLGITFSFGLMALMASYYTMIDVMLMSQFTNVQLFDGKISLIQPVQYLSGLESISVLPGVSSPEGLLELPVELKHENIKRTVMITGIESGSALYKLYDDKRGTNLAVSNSGLILSDRLAEKLNAKVGDELYVSSPLLKDDIKAAVLDICVMSLGEMSFMDINGLSDMFNLNKPVTSLIFNTQSPDSISQIRSLLIDAENVSAIQDKAAIIENNKSMTGPVVSIMGLMEFMSVVVAFAIIYNTSSISLSERKREYSTLRVLGLEIGEIAEILNFENWLLCFAGTILGIPFAKLLMSAVSGMMDVDLFKIPDTLPTYAFIIGGAGCVIAVFLSNLSAVRNIRKFDMVEVLKERE